MDMRTYRSGLIQTHEQLRFSYMAIIEGAKRVLQVTPDSGFQERVPTVGVKKTTQSPQYNKMIFSQGLLYVCTKIQTRVPNLMKCFTKGSHQNVRYPLSPVCTKQARSPKITKLKIIRGLRYV